MTENQKHCAGVNLRLDQSVSEIYLLLLRYLKGHHLARSNLKFDEKLPNEDGRLVDQFLISNLTKIVVKWGFHRINDLVGFKLMENR